MQHNPNKPKEKQAKGYTVDLEISQNSLELAEDKGGLQAQRINQLKQALERCIHAKKYGYSRHTPQQLESQIDGLIAEIGKAGYDVEFTNEQETEFDLIKY